MLELEIAAKSNYATTAGIRVGQSSGAKTSFWPELLENPERTDSNEIRSTAEGIREARDGSALSIRIACTPYVNYMRCM